jgi:hypothetical protein
MLMDISVISYAYLYRIWFIGLFLGPDDSFVKTLFNYGQTSEFAIQSLLFCLSIGGTGHTHPSTAQQLPMQCVIGQGAFGAHFIFVLCLCIHNCIVPLLFR